MSEVGYERSPFDSSPVLYDLLASEYNHGAWVGSFEEAARANGASGDRLLDVACGTGLSFDLFKSREYKITACDLSPSMVDYARTRLGSDEGEVYLSDMCSLPHDREFDLLSCISNSINYLLDFESLTAAFKSAARSLREGGTYIFDVNTLNTVRNFLSSDTTMRRGDTVFRWQGGGTPYMGPGALCDSRIEVSRVEGKALPAAESDHVLESVSHHVTRHWPVSVIKDELGKAGFGSVAIYGLEQNARLVRVPDELHHTHVLFVATRGVDRAV
jgi:SAM-dependent methyltransferase